MTTSTLLIVVLVILLIGAAPALAVQQELGILSERSSGRGCAHRFITPSHRPSVD